MAGNVVNIVVRARNATAAGFRSVQNATRQLGRNMVRHLRSAGSDGAGAFGNGLRGGIGNAFAQAMQNPILATIILATGTALGTMLGAAIAGVLTLAWGGMFVGMGVAFALQSKKVRKDWKNTLTDIGKDYQKLSKPMELVLESARKNLKGLADSFAPYFGAAMKKVQPSVSTFLDYFSKGIKDMGKKAFGPMMVAFEDLLDAFGPEFQEFLGELGDAFAFLAGVVIRNKDEIAQAMHAVLSIITGVVYAVGGLAEAWGQISRGFNSAKEGLIAGWYGIQTTIAAAVIGILTVLQSLTNGFLTMVATMLTGAAGFARALGMDGLAKSLTNAAAGVNGLKATANGAFASMIGKAAAFGAAADRAAKARKLKLEISDWETKAARAKAKLKNTMSAPARKKLTADIGQYMNNLRAAKAALATLHNKHITISASYYITNPGLLAKAHGRATGGNIGAAATGGARRNMTLVGENGPELVRLPGGSHVSSNPDTRRKLAGGGGGGGGPTVIEFKTDGTKAAKLLLELMRESVRSQGGNVQLVLGGRRAA